MLLSPSPVERLTMTDNWPYPEGTLVLGRGSHGLPVRTRCADHIFVTASAAIPVSFGCGYVQSARCLMCNEPIPAIDADFWATRAEPSHVLAVMDKIEQERHRLGVVALDLLDRMNGVKQPLRDFG